MGFAHVYGYLQELFPQIDARLLKAVAIENSKDAYAAVEVVISEILPQMTENEKPSPPLGNLGSQNDLDEEVQEDGGSLTRHHRVFGNANTSQSNFSINIDGEGSSSSGNHLADRSLVNGAPFCDGSDLIDKSYETFGSEAVEAPKRAEESRAISINQISPARLVAMHHLNIAKIPDESNGINESEELILLGMVNKPPASTKQSSTDGPLTLPDVSSFGTDKLRNYGKVSAENQVHSSDYGNEQCQEKNKDIYIENLICQLEHALPQEEAPHANISDVCVEYLNDIDTAAEASDAASSVEGSAIEESLNMTRSLQIVEADLLEQIIEDAKNNKKNLFSAMESVINTMKEVEERERAADQAREEAAHRSSDVWRRIEELKRMIQSAKEANDMHAGEVYGERAILATEVRELQSRLLSLCDERDMSLAILDEMRNALETRLTVADEMIEAASHEQWAKTEHARFALKEQEALMEKVVHQSKVLQEEAEENFKLREFLIDRGRIVDQLQGEIAVICQDVKLLKERFDSGVSLSKSISFGQTSCILASSSSTLGNSTSSDRVPNHGLNLNYKAPDGANLETSMDQSSPRKESRYENGAGADEKDHTDNGWELCDI
ncbi:hypothetical protein SAY87_007677 [Trapa incisa]|uniref:CUE domain-containing protein n=1 Tax=Trapa incisa TaxID=236973 RepID=A0AAN7KFH2_9MYRT|nr:hypothetical protein SAY87_007677 [Trapa incisa]